MEYRPWMERMELAARIEMGEINVETLATIPSSEPLTEEERALVRKWHPLTAVAHEVLPPPQAVHDMGSGESVVLDKMFGPTIFANLRITADVERGWVIERKGNSQPGEPLKWIEWCILPAQLPQDFEEDDLG